MTSEARDPSIGDLEQKKEEITLDNVDVQREQHAQQVKPESLSHLSEDELVMLDKKMVKKMDMVIMPIISVLYILNCKSKPLSFSFTMIFGVLDADYAFRCR